MRKLEDHYSNGWDKIYKYKQKKKINVGVMVVLYVYILKSEKAER